MTNAEFEKYIWAGMERVRCPAPCPWNYETEEEARACYDKCHRHQPARRLSEIIGPKGEDVVVVEEPEPVIYKPRRFKKQDDADATGEP